MHATVSVLTQAAVEYGTMNARGIFAQMRREFADLDPLFLGLLAVAILALVLVLRKV